MSSRYAADNNGPAAAGRNHLYVLAGISAGVAMMSFDLSAAPLEQDRSHPWEDVVELDYVSTLGTAYLFAGMGPDEETDDMDVYELNLVANGPGTYRMRVHARGRGINPDGVQEDDEPIAEHYLIQI